MTVLVHTALQTPQSGCSTNSTPDSWVDSGSKVGPCGRDVNREAALLLVLDELLGRDVDAHELRAASQHPDFSTSLTVRELSVLVSRLHLDQLQQNASHGHTEEEEEEGIACGSQLSYRSVDCCTTSRSWEAASPCSSQAPAGRATPNVPALSMLGMLGQGSIQVGSAVGQQAPLRESLRQHCAEADAAYAILTPAGLRR